MAATDFIVAIELGSSKITGIAGKKHPDGSIQVLAIASEHSSDFIRKGVIYNLDKTAQSLTSIIKKLESTLKASIGKVYVGISGQSLRTIRNTEVRHLEEETKISQELIDSLMDSNREVPIIDQDILEVAPQEYKVGINLLADPVGVSSDHIEGRFLNIIARSNVKQNIDKCFRQANIEIADYIISPLAMADAVLTNSERRSGCMLIDFGADTTAVSVYKNNILRHLAVLPLGGSNITKDICSQQIEEEDAEELKLKYGNAYVDPSTDEDDIPNYSIDGKCNIEAHLLEDIVEARVNEILANVWNQIVLSGYEDKLLAGAIITGGAANLRNMEEAFSKRTKIDKVRMAKDTQLSLKGGVELKKDGMFNTIIALLAAGKENCYRLERPTSIQQPVQAGLFTEEGESMEDKKKRLAQEAEEKRRKEDAEKQRIADCDSFIKKAIELKTAEKYKEALAALAKADILGVDTKTAQIRELEKEIKKLKKGSSIWTKLATKVGTITDDLLKED
ncbi:cell division protein FtsA [Phocaeicola sp.]